MKAQMLQCDSCGQYFTAFEMAETIEEMLCEYCASGIGPSGEEWPPLDTPAPADRTEEDTK